MTTADHQLWCVHVYGPDDLHAAQDEVEAQALATSMNASWGPLSLGRADFPELRAVAELWPWTEESHAADLAERAADPAAYWG